MDEAGMWQLKFGSKNAKEIKPTPSMQINRTRKKPQRRLVS